MSRVQIASQSWGVVTDRRGNALAGVTPTITGGTVYTDTTNFVAQPSLTTDDLGRIPGFLDAGTYTVSYGGQSLQVEALGGKRIYSSVIDTQESMPTSIGLMPTPDQVTVPVGPSGVVWLYFHAFYKAPTTPASAQVFVDGTALSVLLPNDPDGSKPNPGLSTSAFFGLCTSVNSGFVLTSTASGTSDAGLPTSAWVISGVGATSAEGLPIYAGPGSHTFDVRFLHATAGLAKSRKLYVVTFD